jgi:hypothetical protein
VLDCQWLQQLRGDGLLRGALRPGDGAVALRAFARQRHALLRSQAHAVQQRQEAWVQMNLQLTSVIADVGRRRRGKPSCAPTRRASATRGKSL